MTLIVNTLPQLLHLTTAFSKLWNHQYHLLPALNCLKFHLKYISCHFFLLFYVCLLAITWKFMDRWGETESEQLMIKQEAEGKRGVRKEIQGWATNTSGHLKYHMKTYSGRLIKYMHIWKKPKWNNQVIRIKCPS